jgi:HEAT repeat protein/protein involved in polysaccharide export with SLBB domain
MNRWMSPLPVGRAIALGTIALAVALGLGSFGVRALGPETNSSSPETASAAGASQKGGKSTKEATPAPRLGSGPIANEMYRVEPYHVLSIEALGVDPASPILGNYLVEPAGKIDLGPAYGKIAVAGLTLEETEAAIQNLLKQRGQKEAAVSVTLAGWVTKWLNDPAMKTPYHIAPFQPLKVTASGVSPEHPLARDYILVEPGGKINLGPVYGRVAVAGLSLEEAQEAIDNHLKKLGCKEPKASVTLAGWETNWHDLLKQGAWQTPEAPPKSESRKESLRYGNKTFADWRAVLTSDLKPEMRAEAIQGLSAFGAHGYGKEAAEAIIEVMRGYDVTQNDPEDWKVISAAHSAFTKIGSEGFAALLSEWKHGKLMGRRFAISVLTGIGGEGTKAVAPAVLEACKDGDRYIRLTAIASLGRLQLPPKRLLTTLTEALSDQDPQIRSFAAGTFPRMGENAKPAVPALIAALKDENPNVRYSCLRALQDIGPKAQEVLPALILALKDKDGSVRGQALEYLEALGPEAKPTVPGLIEAFNENPTSRNAIARTLGSIGPAAKEALSTLIDFLQQPEAKRSGAVDNVQEAMRKISK